MKYYEVLEDRETEAIEVNELDSLVDLPARDNKYRYVFTEQCFRQVILKGMEKLVSDSKFDKELRYTPEEPEDAL